MITKVAYKDEPLLFDKIVEFSIEEDMNHIRGSNFYRTDIIEFLPEDKEYFPDIKDFDKYVGTWQTNTVIWDDDDGLNTEYLELIRVKKVEKITYEWVTVE